MEKITIQDLRDKGWIVYEYIRGSHAYGTAIEGKSDKDIGGVFIIPKEYLMGLRSNYIEQVADEKNDTVFYEIGRWVELLLKSNPSALESLFIPKHCIIGEVHPIIQHIIDNRDLFLSKEAIKTTIGYSISQISKARGLNKKIVNPITNRKTVLDFCFTFKGQGSQSISDFLSDRNLMQKYCGLVNIPNMKDVYGVYYDFASYINFENLDFNTRTKVENFIYNSFGEYELFTILERIKNKEFFGYDGIVNPDGTSNDIRLSSIPKGEKPLCFMTYNQQDYESHCKKYKEYKEWEKNRNPIRYESNLNKNYDSKNLSHCMRLIRMGKELAKGEGFNVYRKYDKDYLLDIRNHKFEYDEIIEQANKEKLELEEYMKTCTLPDKVDYEKINNLLLKIRKLYYN